MSIKEILTLISSWEEQKGNKDSEKDFALWLYKKHFGIKLHNKESTDRYMGYLTQRIARLGKIVAKEAFNSTNINSHDEFTLLNTVYNNDGISKQTLYQKAVFEMSTGSQIVKRLVRHDLLNEKENEKDKRVKNLFITEKGKNQRDLIFKKLKKHVEFKSSQLTNDQKQHLIVALEIIDQTLYEKFISEFTT